MGFPLTLRHKRIDRLPALAGLQRILSLSVELADHARSILELPEIVDAKHTSRIERIMKLHLQLRHRKAVRDEERPEARLAAVFGQSVRMRCNHLRPAIPTPTFAIGAKPLTQFIARRTLRPQGRIGNCQPIGKRRTQQAILHRAPKRRHPHTVDALKCIRRLRTQQPAPTAQRRRAARLNKKTRAVQIIGHLQPPTEVPRRIPKTPNRDETSQAP